MTDKQGRGEEGRESTDALDRELLNADGQSARLVPNTTGEYSIDRAREGFEKASGAASRQAGEGGQTDGGTGDA